MEGEILRSAQNDRWSFVSDEATVSKGKLWLTTKRCRSFDFAQDDKKRWGDKTARGDTS